MEPCVGINAEYNPFHNGHEYHIAQAKARTGCAHAIVAMSGSFVQRGDVAAFDKFTRASWALAHGADMVLELPTAFACANAQRFAEGGVGLLAATGLVSALAFGAEDADLSKLAALAPDEDDPAFRNALASYLTAGFSFPAARAKACEALAPGSAALHTPNNILAAEYLKALKAFAPHITPCPIPRTGAAHDAPGDLGTGRYASASAMREAARAGDTTCLQAAAPSDVADAIGEMLRTGAAPHTAAQLSGLILYALRRLSLEELAALPDVNEGLENVLYAQARACTDADAFLAAVKTKRYTLARLRRIAMHALLGVDKNLFERQNAPRYLRVLGVRKDALPLLSALSEHASLPVVTGYREYAALDAAAKEQFDLDLFAGELHAMASPTPKKAESEFARPLLIV